MKPNIKHFVITCFCGVAVGAGAATCTWIDGAAGTWGEAAKWVEGVVPGDGDSLSFGATTGAMDDLQLTTLAAIAKTGTGAVTLLDLPGALAIGKLSMAGGTFTLRWRDDTPPETPIPATSAFVGTVDLGGAALKDSTSIASSGGAVTLKNGRYAMTGDFPDNAWNCTVDEGATLDVSGRIYAGLAAKTWRYLTVKNGGAINFTGTGTSVLGTWYNTRWINVSLSGGSAFNHVNGDVWAGASGIGVVTCDNSAFDLGEKTLRCTRPSDNTGKAKNNGTARVTLTNHAVLRAKQITYGNPSATGTGTEGRTDGEFTFKASSGTTIYVASIEGQSNVSNANMTFDDATIVPLELANAALLKDHDERTTAAVHIAAGGLTIANSNEVDIVLAARIDGAGALLVKANSCLVSVERPIACAAVTVENPGRIDLDCEGAISTGRQVTLLYTEVPTIGQVVSWETRPEGVVFTLAGDAAGGYELEESENGIVVKATGARPAVNAYWRGTGEDPSNMLDLANWELRDAADAVMTQGYIDGSTTCHFQSGALAFDLNAAFTCRILYIEGEAVLDADLDWTAAVPFQVTEGASVDLNGHTLALSSLQNIPGVKSTFTGESGGVVFDVAAGKTNEVVGLNLVNPAVLTKRGSGTLRLVDLAGQPVLKQEAGTTLLAWTGEPAVNPFATTPVNAVLGTLSLGGATQTFAAGMGTIFQNGTVLLDGNYTTSNARWSWPSANDVYTVGAGAEVHSAGEWYQMNKQCPQFYVKDGGVFSYESTALCKLGWRYTTRNGKIYLQNGGVWRMNKADLGVGISGNGYLYVQSGSLFDAPTRSIYLDAWYIASDVGYGYMEVVGGSRVNVKKLLFGQDGHAQGNVRFIAKEDSLLCLEYMGPDGTATLPSGLNVTLEGVTIVPMSDTTPESPLLSDGQDYDTAKFHVNGAGLCVSNVNEKTLAFDAKFDGAGPFAVKAFRQDIALASTLACTNVVLTDMRTMTLSEGAQLSLDGGTVRLNYSNGRPVRCGKVISWTPDTQPTDVAFELDEVTHRQFLLEVKRDGVYIASGLVLYLR